MANILRQIIPTAYSVIQAIAADPIRYKSGGADYFDATATHLPGGGEEAVTQGNNLRVFVSRLGLGGVTPVVGDSLQSNSITYRVMNVTANDYEGFFLSLRRV